MTRPSGLVVVSTRAAASYTLLLRPSGVLLSPQSSASAPAASTFTVQIFETLRESPLGRRTACFAAYGTSIPRRGSASRVTSTTVPSG